MSGGVAVPNAGEAHHVGILNDQRVDRAVLQVLEFAGVGVESDEAELCAELLLDDRSARPGAHLRIVGKDAGEVGVLCQHVGRQAHALGLFVVGDPVADDLKVRIGGDALLEALVARIQRFMPGHRGDESDLSGRLSGALLDALRHRVGRRLAAGLVVGCEEGRVLVRLRPGIDDDDGNARGGDRCDRRAQSLEDRRRNDDRRRLLACRAFEDRDLRGRVVLGRAELFDLHAELLAGGLGAL